MKESFVCDVVIPIWNQLELTQRCLQSVLASTSESIRFILIDNGSLPPTRDTLEQFRNASSVPVTLIRNETNLGFIKATNQGIRASTADWICLLNNDTVVTPGWLSEMLQVAQGDPHIGLVNPTSNSLGFHPGKTPLQEYAARLQTFSGQSAPLPKAMGFCLLASRSLLERVGGLDESFGMGNFDDDDLSFRVKKAGLRCVRACAAYVFHEEKASFRHLPGWKEAFQENRRQFEQRWGRSLRILWAPVTSGSAPEVAAAPFQFAAKLADQGHWVTFMNPSSVVPLEFSPHAQVNILKTDPHRWRLQATFRLLSKRKKPFDLVISYDADWSRCLHRLRWFHRAQILHAPTLAQILEQCQCQR